MRIIKSLLKRLINKAKGADNWRLQAEAIWKTIDKINTTLADTNQTLANTNQTLANTNQALANTNQILDKVTKDIDKLKERQEEISEQIRQLREAQAKTDENVGRLTGGWGKFVEGIALPAVIKLANQINLTVEKMFWHAKGKMEKEESKAKGKREHCEVDILLTGKIDKEEFLLAIEIKSAFESTDVNKFLEILTDFHSYFKEFSKYKVIGVVAASRFGDGTDIFLLRNGIYVLRPSDGILEIVVPHKVAIFSKEDDR